MKSLMPRLIRIAFAILVVVLLVSATVTMVRSCRGGSKPEEAAALPDSATAIAIARGPQPHIVVRSILIAGDSAAVKFSVFKDVSPWTAVGDSFDHWIVTRIAPDSATVARDADTVTVGVTPDRRTR